MGFRESVVLDILTDFVHFWEYLKRAAVFMELIKKSKTSQSDSRKTRLISSRNEKDFSEYFQETETV